MAWTEDELSSADYLMFFPPPTPTLLRIKYEDKSVIDRQVIIYSAFVYAPFVVTSPGDACQQLLIVVYQVQNIAFH